MKVKFKFLGKNIKLFNRYIYNFQLVFCVVYLRSKVPKFIWLFFKKYLLLITIACLSFLWHVKLKNASNLLPNLEHVFAYEWDNCCTIFRESPCIIIKEKNVGQCSQKHPVCRMNHAPLLIPLNAPTRAGYPTFQRGTLIAIKFFHKNNLTSINIIITTSSHLVNGLKFQYIKYFFSKICDWIENLPKINYCQQLIYN